MSKQLKFKIKTWGGKRKGAGRKNRSGLCSHLKREKIDIRKPIHITLTFNKVNLRNRATLNAFRHAVSEAKRFCLYVVHYSIQIDHIHLIIEAKDNKSLTTGMKSLCGRFGKIIRAAMGGSGPVFKERFHIHVLKTPTEMKRALKYVLTNTAKHMKVIEHIDGFSTGLAFKEWRPLLGRSYSDIVDDVIKNFATTYSELSPPQSWLARVGWMRAQ